MDSTTSTTSSTRQIVVGLSLSAASRAALHWAAQQARLTGSQLRAVHTIVVPPMMGPAGIITFSGSIDLDAVPDYTFDAINAAYRSVDPEPSWRLELYRGDPGPTLVTQSANAALLVVGTREHTGWNRLLYSSVSHYCLTHAHCAVVAVPATPAGAAGANPDPHLAV